MRKINRACGAPEGAASRKRRHVFWVFAFAARMSGTQNDTVRLSALRSPRLCEGEERE
jgi:hypothetical protein